MQVIPSNAQAQASRGDSVSLVTQVPVEFLGDLIRVLLMALFLLAGTPLCWLLLEAGFLQQG